MAGQTPTLPHYAVDGDLFFLALSATNPSTTPFVSPISSKTFVLILICRSFLHLFLRICG